MFLHKNCELIVFAQNMQTQATIDALTEDVLVDYEQKVDVDKKFNSNEQCLAAMAKTKSKKMWICAGSFFIQMPHKNAEALIQKDQKELQVESQQLQTSLTKKKQQLALLDPEGKYHDAAKIATLK